ncbi:MAG: LysR family transcriptional regulator [Clostridiales bacterium]|nr:LysR family transcriptional regulator [Clostridiales bacterium]
MNLLHLKYAVEVAQTGSINKAAEKLFVGQPNLSRAIKELEGSLGVTIFDRSAKGMVPTPDGEVFIRYAKNILKQVDAVEGLFKKGTVGKKTFSVSVPRACYVADAFARFSTALDSEEELDIFYKETNAMRAIKNILQEGYKLGVIRYAEQYDKYYKDMMDEKGLHYELITEFCYVLVMNRESPLAAKEDISYADLKDLIEIAHADPYVPSLPLSEVKKEELPDNTRQRIFVFERASQLELLAKNPSVFMWVSPVPDELLARYGLVQRRCNENRRVYKDVLIHRNEYRLSDLDKLFISELCEAKRRVFEQNF